MRLYPAVDILGGCAVRLQRGDYAAKTVYDEDPLSAARAWVTEGADALHVVDLDGAKSGQPHNLEQLRRIATELDVEVQYGGGLRSMESLQHTLQAGAARVILGTAALTDPQLLARAISELGAGRVAVAIDVRAGHAATAGWTQASDTTAPQAVALMREAGAERFVYTSVDRDGMLGGPDLDGLRAVAEVLPGNGELIYSGGIGELSDLEDLARSRAPGLAGVIVGKALYEHRFSVSEARAALAS
ncbi:MAG TPA: 1-(5-phosphoribosyl)-5-[(5-phosphoribosylamino)methylideneamino]imidazole-4-carboxamide isomerase [Solirubrobacteraceae bacterium]|nr:1-(5-phosphoribosyl)-5-[(5-phosphoribosylamino)methylideneamino]imidazole-4-carboxamide isomerase [Solirubrobacteraceae bacterium]